MAKAIRLTETQAKAAARSVQVLRDLVDALLMDLNRNASKRVIREDIGGLRRELDRLEQALAYKEQ